MAQQKPTRINVATRRDNRTKRPVLFFYNSNDKGEYWLECYDHKSQHSEVSKDYMRNATYPVSHLAAVNPDVAALVAEWENIGPEADRIPAHCVARLPVPRKSIRYIGK